MKKANKKAVKGCASVETRLCGHLYVHTVAKIFNIDRIYSDTLCLFCYSVWVNELMVHNVSSE